MSSLQHADIRQRWAARSMILRRWIAVQSFAPGGEICELTVDGESVIVRDRKLQPGDTGGVYWHYVREGDEVGPSALLLEYSDSAAGRPGLKYHPSTVRRLIRRPRYPRVFISYRRADSEGYTARLHEALVARFGRDEVFLDEFSIRGGENYRWTLQQAVTHAEAIVAVVGSNWMVQEDNEPRAIARMVRLELRAALDRGIPVLPVLLPGVRGPVELPRYEQELAPLLDVQYMQLAGARHWAADVELVIESVREHLRAGDGAATEPAARPVDVRNR